MRDFVLYITSTFQTVPVMAIVSADNEVQASKAALSYFTKSDHYVRIEVCEHNAVLFTLDRPVGTPVA